MARTVSGNLTGRAAVEERREIMDLNYKKYTLEQQKKLMQRESDLIDEVIELVGFEKFESWWDDDNNVPVFGARQMRIALLEKYIEEVKSQSVN